MCDKKIIEPRTLEYFKIINSVGQSCILLPQLFAIYTNDVLPVVCLTQCRTGCYLKI